MITPVIKSRDQSIRFESDVVETTSGRLTIYFIGHASLIFEINRKYIYVDPWSKQADYSKLPKADLVLITHHHTDHLDPEAIRAILKENTSIAGTQHVFDSLQTSGIVMKNGDKTKIGEFEIEAVPAYNTTEGRDKYHPRGRDNGYILSFADKRIYIAGDTENIPEMENILNIDIAFLPMNQPYTMLPEQVAEVALKIRPGILYPYHYGDTDALKLKKLLSSEKEINVLVRKLH